MKTDVLTLCAQLSNGQGDPVTMERLYRDVVYDLGREDWLTNFRLIPISSGGGSVQMPNIIVNLLTMMYDDEQLGPLTLKQAQYVDASWRDQSGVPFSYVLDGETRKYFRLFPWPTQPSKPFIFVHGSPLGLDFPAYAVCAGATEVRTDVIFQLDLPVALLVLEKEFERESDHTDPAFAQGCGNFARVLMEMVRP